MKNLLILMFLFGCAASAQTLEDTEAPNDALEYEDYRTAIITPHKTLEVEYFDAEKHFPGWRREGDSTFYYDAVSKKDIVECKCPAKNNTYIQINEGAIKQGAGGQVYLYERGFWAVSDSLYYIIDSDTILALKKRRMFKP